MKVWAKIRSNGDYHSINIANAVDGFRQFGAEIIKYEKIDEIYNWVLKDDIVLDYIDQVNTILSKFNVVPELFNYPDEMHEFLGRKVWTDTINNINTHPELWGIFVKPIKEKVFTGRIINSPKDLIGCGSSYENYDVICSEVVDFKREYRAFITYDKIIDIRPYKGDYHYHLDENVVDKALEAFKNWENRPMGCSIDFGVTKDNRTLLVEVNDGYALGSYGLFGINYAKLISARWSQLLDRPDIYLF